MMNDLLDGLIRANLAGGTAALLMLGLRDRLRPLIGPSAVYALWLTAPAAAFASLLPARTVRVVMEATAPVLSAPRQAASAPSPVFDATPLLITLWLTGVVVAALWVGWKQLRFLALFGLGRTRQRVVKSASDKAGPAVVGVLTPRILLPADFVTRFSPMQRRVILAHEGVHLSRGDSRINAAVLLLQCLGWFNPVVHLAARAMRLDQELSCDAVVMARFPRARRSYAEAMLKSQAGAVALPMGCYWPARGPSALTRRLSMLRVSPVSRTRMMVGLSLAGLMAASAGMTAWSFQPPRELIILKPRLTAALPESPTLASHAASGLTARAHRAKTGGLDLASVAPAAAAAPTETVQTAARPSLSRIFEWTAMPMSPEDEETGIPAAQAGVTAPDGRLTRQTGAGQTGAGQASASYRNGEYHMKSDFVQVGDQIEVSAQLFKNGAVIGTGTASTVPGETAYVSLSNGQLATITPGATAYLITRPPDQTPRYRPAPS